MFEISQNNLQAVLKQLEQAIYNHEQWHKELTRTLVCRLPYDHRDMAEDAHEHCRFGQWYYSSASEEFRSHDAFVSIDIEHRRMHQAAGIMLRTLETEVSISPADYDNFANALERLHLEIFSLKREIEDSLYNRDSLTGAENRISMLTKLRDLHMLVKRGVQQCCIAIADLDHFKTINDAHGHLVGDKVLSAAARHVKQHLRAYDTVFRYGGEEFLISMPNTVLQTSRLVIERIRDTLAASPLLHEGPDSISITASFGVAEIDPNVPIEESIDRADKAMYSAKTAGRNRTCVWTEPVAT